MDKQVVSLIEAVQAPKTISVGVLTAFYSDADAEKAVGQADQSRLEYLFGYFPMSALADVQTACKEYRKAHKDTPTAKTANQRSKEAAALFGAFTFAGFKPSGMGYHATVQAAYAALKSKGIKANGAKIPERWEKQVNEQATNVAEVWKATEYARRKAEQQGKDFTDEQAAEVQAKAREDLATASARKFAATLMKRKGGLWCGYLCNALIDLVNAAIADDQESGDVKEQAKAA